MVPTHMFLTRGVGVHREKLASFEQALRSAGVAYCNLVSVSSILPPNCKIIPRKRGETLLNPGEITFCVMARSARPTDGPPWWRWPYSSHTRTFRKRYGHGSREPACQATEANRCRRRAH